MTRRPCRADPMTVGTPVTLGWRAACVLVLTLLTAACASPAYEAPPPPDEASLRARAVATTQENIRVSAAVPSAEETKAAFGIDLDKKGIQPIWLEIANGSPRRFVFLPAGLDPEYFAPLEAAFLYKDDFSEESYERLANRVQSVSFDHRSPILPGETASGFVLINKVDPTIIAEIDLVGQNWSRRIDLLVPLPGTDAAQQAIASLGWQYDASEIVEIEDEAELRRALEALPCCTTDKTGRRNHLPLNLVLIGKITNVAPPFGRRKYRYRALEPDYALGRRQDFSSKKTSRWVAPQPHLIRAWLTPLRYRGQPVTVAQISTLRGGRFADPSAGQRQVEPNVDTARNDIVQDLIYSQSLAKIGFVKAFGQGALPDDAVYRSDGLRAVLLFTGEPVSFAEIEFFDWERPVDYRLDAQAQ